MQAKGYWVRGNKILDMGQNHVEYIVENPKEFNVTTREIEDKYKEFGEVIGREGKAREYLIRKVSKDGWIRVRHYIRPRDFWSVQCDNINARRKDIKNFIEAMIYDYEAMSSSDELKILGYDKNELEVYTFQENGAEKFLSEHKTKKVNMIMESYSKTFIIKMSKDSIYNYMWFRKKEDPLSDDDHTNFRFLASDWLGPSDELYGYFEKEAQKLNMTTSDYMATQAAKFLLKEG